MPIIKLEWDWQCCYFYRSLMGLICAVKLICCCRCRRLTFYQVASLVELRLIVVLKCVDAGVAAFIVSISQWGDAHPSSLNILPSKMSVTMATTSTLAIIAAHMLLMRSFTAAAAADAPSIVGYRWSRRRQIYDVLNGRLSDRRSDIQCDT